MRIHVSSAEQKPYDFKSITKPWASFTITTGHMETADYGVCRPQQANLLGGDGPTPWKELVEADPAACAIVERKSLADLFGSIGGGRTRLDYEMKRMQEYGYRAVVIEANWSMILNPNEHLQHATRVNVKSAVASIIAWSERHGVHFHAMVNRAMAEQFTYRLLERWIRDGSP